MLDNLGKLCYVLVMTNTTETETQSLLQQAREIAETHVSRDGDKFVAQARDLRYRPITNSSSLAERVAQNSVAPWHTSRSDTADDALRCVIALAACGYGDPAKIARYQELTKKFPPRWRREKGKR